MSRTVPFICAALLLTAAAPAFAQSHDERRTSVYSGDLDLYTAKGSAELLDRIENAAADVCDPDRGPLLTSERETAAQCEFETTLSTVDRVGHPGLSSQYEGRFPQVIISEGDADYVDPDYAPQK